MQAWIAPELATADLGDERLDRRFALVLDRLSARPNVSIPAACTGRAETKAAYAFFANERVTAEKVLAPHRGATVARVRAQAVVLAVQDTTEADLTRPHEQVGGPLNDDSRRGFFDHVLLAFTPDGLPLGVVQATLWARPAEGFGAAAAARKKKPIEDKESYRWLEGYRQACWLAGQAPQTTVVCVADSEGDIHECFAEAQPRPGPQARWIVRACQDRRLVGSAAKLFDEVAAAAVLGTLTVEVRPRPQTSADGRKRRQARSGRTTTVTVQAARVQVRGPKRPGGKRPDLWVNAVLVREAQPPAGEEPIEWLLLTDLPIGTFEEASQVIAYYGQRWGIEVYFRVLKSGCTIEELQLEADERLLPCLALYMIVAWRVLFVTMLGRECPDLPCDVVFEEAEWKAVYTVVKKKPVPQEPPRLVEMVAMIASLGGHLGRKHDGPPGPKTMWIGLQRMQDFATGWVLFGGAHNATG
jgi:hypothetical protein